jgi:hypothetical protein
VQFTSRPVQLLHQAQNPLHPIVSNRERDAFMTILGHYTAGNYDQALSLCNVAIQATPHIFAFYEIHCKSLAYSGVAYMPPAGISSVTGSVLCNVFNVIAKNAQTDRSLAELRKTAYAFSRFSFGQQIYAFYLEHREPDHVINHRRYTPIASVGETPRFTAIYPNPTGKLTFLRTLSSEYPQNAAVDFFSGLLEHPLAYTTTDHGSAVPRYRQLKFRALTLEHEARHEEAIPIYRVLRSERSALPPLQHDSIAGLFRCYVATGALS